MLYVSILTHWGRVTHIYVGNLTTTGSYNGLSPGRRQAIIWTNARILSIEPLGTNFSEILIGIQILSFKKMRLKMSSAKWRPFCLGLNVLTMYSRTTALTLWQSCYPHSDNNVTLKAILQGSFRLCNWLFLWRLVSWVNHWPPVCWYTFWKSTFKQQLGCRFNIMDCRSSLMHW